jgi:hypothetical protein
MTERRFKTLEEQLMPDLKAFVRLCFACIDETDIKVISNRTQLSVSTLYRLDREDFTGNIRWMTIAKLGNAAGLRLKIDEVRKRATIEQTQVLPDSFYLSSKK